MYLVFFAKVSGSITREPQTLEPSNFFCEVPVCVTFLPQSFNIVASSVSEIRRRENRVFATLLSSVLAENFDFFLFFFHSVPSAPHSYVRDVLRYPLCACQHTDFILFYLKTLTGLATGRITQTI